MRFLLATETDCHSSLHWDEVPAGDRSDQIGFLEVRRGGGWLKKYYQTTRHNIRSCGQNVSTDAGQQTHVDLSVDRPPYSSWKTWTWSTV